MQPMNKTLVQQQNGINFGGGRPAVNGPPQKMMFWSILTGIVVKPTRIVFNVCPKVWTKILLNLWPKIFQEIHAWFGNLIVPMHWHMPHGEHFDTVKIHQSIPTLVQQQWQNLAIPLHLNHKQFGEDQDTRIFFVMVILQTVIPSWMKKEVRREGVEHVSQVRLSLVICVAFKLKTMDHPVMHLTMLCMATVGMCCISATMAIPTTKGHIKWEAAAQWK